MVSRLGLTFPPLPAPQFAVAALELTSRQASALWKIWSIQAEIHYWELEEAVLWTFRAFLSRMRGILTFERQKDFIGL